MLNVTYSEPYLGIKLEEENGQWIVADPYYKEWAAKHQIAYGDIVLNIDGTEINELPNITYDPVIRVANELILMKSDGKIIHVQINPLDIPKQFYYVLVVPGCYYFLSLIISFYLYYKQRNTNLINLLILFILIVSLAYVSIGAAGRLDSVGIVVNRSSMLLCLVILIHF